jgi:hypothetical protein
MKFFAIFVLTWLVLMIIALLIALVWIKSQPPHAEVADADDVTDADHKAFCADPEGGLLHLPETRSARS